MNYVENRWPQQTSDNAAAASPMANMTIEILPEVASALALGQGVVALESTLLCHGLPRPDNAEVALELEQTVRDRSAVPATVAAIDGMVNVGLCRRALDRLLEAPEVAKCTTRDLPLVLAKRRLGATTIAATVFIASRVGIRVMATGGLGGVHRGGERSMDVSADLEELARRPVTVVCSGVKSILDQGRTLERLESLGCRWSVIAATSCPASIRPKAVSRCPR